MFMKTKYILPLLIVILTLFVGSAYATWYYACQPAIPVRDDLSLSLNVFDFAPDEIIPGGDIEAPLGENHLDLIEIILNEPDYGLNAKKKPIMHNVLKSNGVIYCDQNVQGGNMKHLMVDSSAYTERLYFLLSKVSDTEYHAFTLSYYDLREGDEGSEIHVYKTVLEKGDNGKWTAPRSYSGYATIIDPGIVSAAIDYRSWRQA